MKMPKLFNLFKADKGPDHPTPPLVARIRAATNVPIEAQGSPDAYVPQPLPGNPHRSQSLPQPPLAYPNLAPGRSNTRVAADADADAAAYGNKTANLEVLDGLLIRHKLTGQFQVPRFIGISDASVLAHIERHTGFALDVALSLLYAALPPEATSLGATAETALADVQLLLRIALTKHPMPVPARWLAELDGARLMVRSSGREDSETLANAGGNLSVANVPSQDRLEVQRAITEVLCSYWSVRSFAQRLAARDNLRAPPFMPVLLQAMAGERPGGPIYSSGVLFTEEPEGPTPGVAQVQATFGHAEAVVASLLPCDTFYRDASGIRSLVAYKPQRLVPTAAAGVLAAVANSTVQRLTPALPKDILDRLFELGRIVEDHYRCPMDIEWTYDSGSRLLYLLQARPLVRVAQAQPSHLVTENIDGLSQLRVRTVGAGGGRVRQVARAEQLMLAPNLVQALELFLAHPRPEEIEGVLVTGQAEPTSHEATTLRAAQVPVMQVADLAATGQFIRAHLPLALDPAAGLLVGVGQLMQPSGGSLAQQLRSQNVLRDGWGQHPVAAAVSVFEKQPALAPADMLSLWRSLAATLGVVEPSAPLTTALSDDPAAALVALLPAVEAAVTAQPQQPLATLLRLAAAEDRQVRNPALAQLLCLAHRQARRLAQVPELAPRAWKLVRVILTAALQVDGSSGPQATAMQRLLQVNWIEAAFSQRGGQVGADSFASLTAEMRALSRFAPRDTQSSAYAPMQQLALRPEVGDAWEKFTARTESYGAHLSQRLAQLVLRVVQLGIAPLWLNTTFAQQAQNWPLPRGLLTALERDMWSPANVVAMAWAKDANLVTARWRARLGEWADPDKFADLAPDFLAELSGEQFAAGASCYLGAAQSGKMVTLAWLNDTVELYDATIKALSGSALYAGHPAQLMRFGALIMGFQRLLTTWIKAAPALAERLSGYVVNGAIPAMAEGLLDKKMEGLMVDGGHAKWEMANHPHFRVMAAKLGSGTDFSQQQPRTLEDFFTFTHQSLVTVQAALNVEVGLTAACLPTAMEALCTSLLRTRLTVVDEIQVNDGEDGRWRDTTREFGGSMQLAGIQLTYPQVRVEMQLPLREHSLLLHFSMDVRQPEKAELHVQMFGLAEHARQERLMLIASLFSAATGLSFVDAQGSPVTRRQDVDEQSEMCQTEWTWQVQSGLKTAQVVLLALPQLFEHMGKTTFFREPLNNLLDTMHTYVPDIQNVLARLPESFFVTNPGFSLAFLRLGWDPGTGQEGRIVPGALLYMLNQTRHHDPLKTNNFGAALNRAARDWFIKMVASPGQRLRLSEAIPAGPERQALAEALAGPTKMKPPAEIQRWLMGDVPLA